LGKSFLNTFLTPTAHLLISRLVGVASLCGHERTQFDSTGKWNGARVSYPQQPGLPNERTKCCKDFGLRWQSAAATPLWDASQRCKSGVALRFPPHSKKFENEPRVAGKLKQP
jgi:hypothetical protein